MLRTLLTVLLAGLTFAFCKAEEAETDDASPRDDVSRIELSAEDLADLNSVERGTLGWGLIHQWEKIGNYEAIARAFEVAADRGALLQQYGANLALQNKHEKTLEYLEKFYPVLAVDFAEGVSKSVAEAEEVERLKQITAESPDGFATLTDALESSSMRVRGVAMRNLMDSAGDKDLKQFLTDWLPSKAATNSALATAFMGQLLLSKRDWTRDYASEYLKSAELGWDLLLTAARAKCDLEELEWLRVIQDKCPEEVAAHVKVTIGDIERALEPEKKTEAIPASEE